MSVKRTCAISSVRLDPESGGLGFGGASDISVEYYVSVVRQAMMLREFKQMAGRTATQS